MKITITIEDTPRGTVKVESNPTFEHIMQTIVNHNEETSAMGYALCAINAIRTESKKQAPTKILIPRTWRR